MMARTVKEVDNEEELKNAFKVFDKDGSGTISATELRTVLQHLGENLTDDDLDEMLKMADKNGDGDIDCEDSRHSFRASTRRLALQKLTQSPDEEFVHIMTRD